MQELWKSRTKGSQLPIQEQYGRCKQRNKRHSVKCFKCNTYAAHIAKDCSKEKKTKEKKETGMFVGTVETIEIHEEKSNTDVDFEKLN